MNSVTVPFMLDHNRMVVEADVQRKDGTWRKARLWVDSGNPEFFASEALAGAEPPIAVRLGGTTLNLEGVTSKVLREPRWVFGAIGIDGNLPSTVLRKYHVIFDYPAMKLTLAVPGALKPRGLRASASIHPETGIVQIDGTLDGELKSFALDNGASYSFVPDDLLAQLSARHKEWPKRTGAVGAANIWGWWPKEETWPLLRVPAIDWGGVHLSDVGMAGLPKGFAEWYSKKTARPVAGILGANAFKSLRVEIDYEAGAVYFEPGAASGAHDMDLVPLTLRPEEDGTYQIIGSAAPGVQAGDKLIQAGAVKMQGATLGAAVDALRGAPGEIRTLLLDRQGRSLNVEVRIARLL